MPVQGLSWSTVDRQVDFQFDLDLEHFLLERDLASLEPLNASTCHAPKRMKREGEKQAVDRPQAIRALQKRIAETNRARARNQQ